MIQTLRRNRIEEIDVNFFRNANLSHNIIMRNLVMLLQNRIEGFGAKAFDSPTNYLQDVESYESEHGVPQPDPEPSPTSPAAGGREDLLSTELLRIVSVPEDGFGPKSSSRTGRRRR
ncbi:uncharacterized protein [Oscarella lobularis]|uniref:uncharacterized protein isoform X4 n=1 Tax=Oscarella lobularis TaxID=121494 RepID=UPI003313378E